MESVPHRRSLDFAAVSPEPAAPDPVPDPVKPGKHALFYKTVWMNLLVIALGAIVKYLHDSTGLVQGPVGSLPGVVSATAAVSAAFPAVSLLGLVNIILRFFTRTGVRLR